MSRWLVWWTVVVSVRLAPRPSFALLATVVIGILAHPREGGAVLFSDINLMEDGLVPGMSQINARWGDFPVGPLAQAGGNDGNGPVNIARCGCHLTTLAAALDGIMQGALPWYGHQQYVLNAQEQSTGATRDALEMSPKYLDDYFNFGPSLENQRITGWGFLPGSGGSSCTTATYPWASTGAVNPGQGAGVWPTGVTWLQTSWSWMSRDYVDSALAQGIPTIVYRKNSTGGLHANLIVGWDNTKSKYLVWDPMWASSNLDLYPEPRIASLGAGTEDQRYQNYVNAIQDVFLLEPVLSRSLWMYLRDDPEPIELRLTDPRGRRTGWDPETGENLQEDPTTFYAEFTSFADPLGLFEEAPAFRYLAARDPEPGAYGVEVFGTGDGHYELTLGTVDGDQQEDATTISGETTEGAVALYEIERAPNGSVTIEAVDAFGPRARAGNDAFVFLGGDARFDGRGSYQVDGEVAAHSWDFGDGDSADGAQQSHVYAAAGTYTATLTVTGSEGLTGTDERTVVVIDPATLPQMETVRVSVTAEGLEALGGDSLNPQVTPDGRFVAFESSATNLADLDSNESSDVFVKDLSNGAIERASVATGGAEDPLTNTPSYAPVITPDGRFVVFNSSANLYEGDEWGTSDMLVRDRTLGTTEFVARFSGSVFHRGSISTDGRYVAFQSFFAPAPLEDEPYENVYILDRQEATYEIVSLTDAGGQADGDSSSFVMSADGNTIAFLSEATNLDDQNRGSAGLFVRDRGAGTTELVSLTEAGNPITRPWAIIGPAISADGRFVAFGTDESDVVASENNNGGYDVFVRDRDLGITEHISVSSTGEGADQVSLAATISPDGRYVAFVSAAQNLAPDAGGGLTTQAYLRDRQEQTTIRVSVDSNSTPAEAPGVYVNNGNDQQLSVALDGAVVFPSNAANLVPDDFNVQMDVFIRRLAPGSDAATTPIANLGGPYVGWASSELVPAGVRLDGSGSADPMDRSLAAHWDFGDGSPVVDGELVTTHAYAAPGIYTVSLTVSADDDTSTAITTEVEVMPGLSPDALSAGACAPPDGTLTIMGAAISVNAPLVAQGWDRSTGPLPIEPVIVSMPWGEVSVPTRLPGLTFRTDVTVPAGYDSGGYVATSSGTPDAAFDVPCATLADRPPLAVAGGPLYRTQEGVSITLDGSGSTDPEGSPLTYLWRFGDGTTGEGATPAHTYAFEGAYMVTLIVNDGVNDSADEVGTQSFAMVLVSAGQASDGGGGCGCSTARKDAPLGLAFGLLLLLLARRGRRAPS